MSRRAIVKRAKVKRGRNLRAEYVYRIIGSPKDELLEMLLGPGEWEPVEWMDGVERRRKAPEPKRWVAKKFRVKDMEPYDGIDFSKIFSCKIVWGES